MEKAQTQKIQKLLYFLAYISPFFFPLYLLRFSVYSIPFTVLEIFTYFFFAILFLAIVLGTHKIVWKKSARWYYLLAFILFLGATLGVVTAPHYIALPSGELQDSQMIALGIWKGWIFAPMLYFFTFTQAIDSSDKLKKLALYFVYSGAVVALISYFFAFSGAGFTYDLRLAGFFESANYLSLYLGPPLLLGIYFLLHSDRMIKGARFLNLSSVTVMVHAIFLTQSYAAIIGIFGALGLYILTLLIRYKKGFLKVFLSLLGLLIFFGLLAFSQRDSDKFKQFLDFENRSSSTVRLEIYEVSWNLVKTYPLTGVGPGLFQSYYQAKAPEILGQAPMEWNMPHPHNIFLAFWLNAGILGLLALLGFLVLSHTRLTYPIIALWGIIIHGLFDTPFWKNDLAMIFWFVLGAILILQTYGSSTSQERKNPIRKRATIRRSSSVKARKLTT